MENIAFKAMIVTESSDKQFTREIKEKHIADLPEGEVLIKVHYSSLNYKDALSASGNKGVTRKYPHTPGVDAAGVIAESSDSGFKSGEEVLVTGYDLGMNTSGGYEEYIRVPANWVVRLPKNLSLRESMIYGTAGFTAALSCYKLINNGVTPDKGPVLVTRATGGEPTPAGIPRQKRVPCGSMPRSSTGDPGMSDATCPSSPMPSSMTS